jgi:hypothetical protein
MKKIVFLQEIVELNNKLLHSEELLERGRRNSTDFTRNRKMPFTDLILFMVNLVRGTTQVSLNRFFSDIKRMETRMTQQAFSEARQKLNWEVFRLLMDKNVEWFYELISDYKKWKGYRVTGVDGSKIQLPSDAKLRDKYGTIGRGETAVTGQGSTLCDVLNDVIIDAQLMPMSVGERTLAKEHITFLRSMSSFDKELTIFDRGYASFDMIKDFIQGDKPIKFLFRLRTKFNVAIDDLEVGDHKFTLTEGNDSFDLRVIKFELDGGEIETLLTNLEEQDITLQDFKELYFKRWPIEIKYGELKHKLEIENFSGLTELAILQDFYITAFVSNMLTVATIDAQILADDYREGKDNKYTYRINKNQAVGSFKDQFIRAFLIESTRKRNKQVLRIIREIGRSVVPVRPGRKVFRNPNPRKANFYHNQKSNC